MLAERFADKWVPEPTSGCWLWTAALSQNGYGKLSVRAGRPGFAHRISWELHRGEKVPSGAFVCHRCDTPGCVNPDHLFVGSPKDNTQDAIKKGRFRQFRILRGDENPMRAKPWLAARGERAKKSRITVSDVPRIRERAALGERLSAIASDFGVSFNAIRLIVKRINWRHVP